MEKIFLWVGSQKYAGYVGVSPEDEKKMCWDIPSIGQPLPALDDWETPLLTQYLGDGKKLRKPKKIGDSPSAGLPMLISQRAADALRDIWNKHAILYPVKLNDSPDNYYMVKVITMLDCLDESSSKVVKNHKGMIRSVEQWKFKPQCLGGADLFVLPYHEAVYYVSDVFRCRVVAAGLKGFVFKNSFWEVDPFTS